MIFLRRHGGSGDGGGGGSGGGGACPSSRCGAVRWGASGGGQKRQRESLTPQQLREWCTSRGGGGGSSGGHSAAVPLGWYVQRGASPSSTRCTYVIRTGDRAGQTCRTFGHTQSRCFSCLSDTWRAEFGDATELPRWLELARQRVDIFALDYDAILIAMYALSFSAEGDCSRCVPPDPGVAAAALGASASGTPPGTAPAEALHSFTLDSGASRCFFRDSTTLTPLPAPVPVRLADPFGGPVVASSSTVLPCPAVPSGSLLGLHLPSFSTNLVSTAALQDAMVTTTAPGGSSLYTLATEPPETLLWHHHLGHPSLPRLRGMHSRLLVSDLPRSLPPLPPLPAPPCLPCVEGRQRAAPHSSSFPPTTDPLQTLHMDVWGPARVSGQGRERYFLLVVDDYTWYTTVFPLRNKGEVSGVLIPWIHTVRLLLRERFGQDLIEVRRIGLFMEVARTSMIHAAAPHFLWPFAVRYAAHQLNLWPRVSLPETLPTLRWTGKVGDASVFRFYHPTSCHVLPSKDVTFDESVPFYRLFPYRSAPSPPPPLFLAPGPPPVDPSRPRGAGSGGAEPEGVEPGGAESEGTEPEGAKSEGAEFGGVEPRGAASSGVPAGASPRLSSQQLREWLVQRAHRRSGAPGGGEPGDAGAGGAAVTTGAGDPTEPGAAGAGGAGAGVAGVGGPGAGGIGGAGAGAVDPGAGGAGGTVRPRPFFVPLLQQVLGVPSSTGLTPPFLCLSPDQSQPLLQPASPLPASRPVSHVCTARRAPRSRPPSVPGTHTMALRPSSVPLRVPLPAPFDSSLLEVPDPESDRARAASPTVAHLLATAITDPSFECTATSALVAELLDPAAACCLDYASALVAESVPARPPSVVGECALGTDVLEDRQEDFECLAAAVPHFASLLLAPDIPDIPPPPGSPRQATGGAPVGARALAPPVFVSPPPPLPPYPVLGFGGW
ncbi:unnamed protein product [Closterium sp. NIES-53]